MYTDKDIETAKNIMLKNIPDIRATYLFGSYARGTADEKSDIDMLTLTGHRYHWRERQEIMNRLYAHLGEKNLEVDIIVKLEEEFHKDQKLPTISRKIAREGVRLWKGN